MYLAVSCAALGVGMLTESALAYPGPKLDSCRKRLLRFPGDARHARVRALLPPGGEYVKHEWILLCRVEGPAGAILTLGFDMY